MKALNLATVQKDKQALDAKCQEWLTRAEKIKGAKDWQSAARVHSAGGFGLRHPSSTRKLTTREEIILLEGAKLNNFVFPPWTHPPAPSEFKLESGKEPFTYVPGAVAPFPRWDVRCRIHVV